MSKSEPTAVGTFRGAEQLLCSFGGVRAVRVSHAGGRAIGEHSHDWPTLTFHVAGAGTEMLEAGPVRLAEPSAILLPAGHAHADAVDAMGLETFGLVFAPVWLAIGGRARFDRTRVWSGGSVAIQARRLAALWSARCPCEETLRVDTAGFLEMAFATVELARPTWLTRVRSAIRHDPQATTGQIAQRLALHPAWLARAYRAASGEGLQDALRRRRVERALELINTTWLPLAEIAVAAGFCDQSHMNRCFGVTIGLTPLAYRSRVRPAVTAPPPRAGLRGRRGSCGTARRARGPGRR